MRFYILFSFFFSFHLFWPKEILSQPTTANQKLDASLSCITFNVWGLPIGKGKKLMTQRLPGLSDSLLIYSPDIIALQETFHPQVRQNFIQGILSSYHCNPNYLCNSQSVLFFKSDCYGGLMTFSQHPLVKEEFHRYPKFKKMNFFEKRGKKGFLISLIDSPYGTLCVVNTHLYSGRSGKAERIRLQQVTYLMSTLEEKNYTTYPILFLGDFNMVHPSISGENKASDVYKYIIETKGFSDTVNIANKNDLTYTKEVNSWAYPSEGGQKLDYVFYKSNESYQFELQEEKVIFNTTPFLSDHFGLYCKFR